MAVLTVAVDVTYGKVLWVLRHGIIISRLSYRRLLLLRCLSLGRFWSSSLRLVAAYRWLFAMLHVIDAVALLAFYYDTLIIIYASSMLSGADAMSVIFAESRLSI